MVADDLLRPDQTERFPTWQAAKEFLRSLEGRYVFRGMPNAEWVPVTTLDRTAHYRALETEQVLVDSFQKALPKHIADDVPPLDDRLSWLALVRHYGLPSRLLDCTESHAVAAYFAAQIESESDFAIWAIQKESVQRAAAAALGILGEPPSPLELGRCDLFSAVFTEPKRFIALVDAGKPTARQRAQKGLFLCSGDPCQPFWRNLPPEICDRPDSLYRVILPPDARNAIGEDLCGTEVNYANLLPDIHRLEELCCTLETLLKRSQEPCGHLQWKLQVQPLLKEHGLLDLKLA